MKSKIKYGIIAFSAITGSMATPLVAASCSCFQNLPVFQCNLTFDAGEHGDITQGQKSVKVTKGTKFAEINAPVITPKTGYIFTGWQCDKETISENTTVKAQYKLYDEGNKVTLTFDLDGGVLLTGTLTKVVNKGTLFKNINTPTFAYKDASKIFNGWDHDGNTEINENMTIKAKWRDAAIGEIVNTLNFCIDGTEKLESGFLQFQVPNGATWQEIRANSKFPTITNTGYKIAETHGYYVPSNDGDPTHAWVIEDNTVFSFAVSTIVNININWIKINPEQWINIIFNVDSEKGEITAGQSTVQALSGVLFGDVNRPIVKGKTVGTKRYVQTGWDVADTKELTSNTTVNAVFKEVVDTTYTYTVQLSPGNYGTFPEGTQTSYTITYTAEEKPTKVTFGDFKLKYGDPIEPTPIENYKFVGWDYSATQEIQEGVNQVTALYEYNKLYQLAFVGKESDEIITGAASVQYEESTKWNEFNKPVATKSGWTFTDWAIKTGDGTSDYFPIGNNYEKSLSQIIALAFSGKTVPDIITIVPIFLEDVQLTEVVFTNTDTSMGTISGATSIKVQDGKKFSQINKPEVTPIDCGVFKGWYDEDGNEVTKNTVLTGATKEIKAVWDINWDYMCSVTSEKGAKIEMTVVYQKPIEYSIDKADWVKLESTSTTEEKTINLTAGQKIYFRRNENTVLNGTNIKITAENGGDVVLGGWICSLLNWKNPSFLVSENHFKELFKGSTGLTKVTEDFLDVGSYQNQPHAFEGMFEGCSNLKVAPKLPSTLLILDGCYKNMFKDCVSLVVPPELPSTSISEGVYEGMFQGCTSLLSTPELKAKRAPSYCYKNMFKGCTNLKYATDLPASTWDGMGASSYEGMFQDCVNLIKGPSALAVPRGYTYGYKNMFNGCASLTTLPIIGENGSIPSIAASQEEAFSYMFEGCSKFEFSTTGGEGWTLLLKAPDIIPPSSTTSFQNIISGISLNAGQSLYYKLKA